LSYLKILMNNRILKEGATYFKNSIISNKEQYSKELKISNTK